MKLALTIGINDYPGTGADLHGCVNDANAWAHTLHSRGFAVAQLLDAQATHTAIRTSIGHMIEEARWGDVVVVTFSGHGTWTVDADGDEADGRDEALCPHDVTTAGPLLDDDLHEMFARRRHGARVLLVSDSCHSGTVTRFAAPLHPTHPRVRFLPPAHHTPPAALPLLRVAAALPARGRSRPTALLMSGCADPEYSYDGYAGQAMGAFSAVALAALAELPAGATYRDWHRAIRRSLPAQDTPQTPQLAGTRTQVAWPVFEGIGDRS